MCFAECVSLWEVKFCVKGSRTLDHRLLFSPFSVVGPTQIFGIFKKKVYDVAKPFFCRIGVSVVDPFSLVVLILQ